ncbi:MAG: S41 family peptidase [Pirellulales bacterium]|nr:S41 family peptidase [Pirellulales bacterium]
MILRWFCLLPMVVFLIAPAWADEPVAPSEAPPATTVEDEYELQRMLVDTLDQVERNYVKQITRRELVEAAIDGILRKLDPYSSYIAPSELDQFRTNMESQFGGIGIQVTMDEGQLQVLSPLVNTPAYRAGILAGDEIVEIDGKSTEGIGLDESVRRLKGEIGSEVTLTVIHPGQTETEKITMVRQRIQVETVLGDRRKANDSWDFMYDAQQRIGYIRITAFSRGTSEELRKALKSLKKENLAGLILDLRFNPGGLLSSAIEVSDIFVDKGRIVSTSGRNTPERTWDSHKENTLSGFRMVVLVNRFTASAGEIVSACLQDHKRAVIMGERTWGKGSVQNVVPLEHGHSALKLTTASYQRPSGKNIHRFPNATEKDDWGVTPDEGYAVELSTADMVTLITSRRDRDIVRPKQPEATTAGPSASGKDVASAGARKPKTANVSEKRTRPVTTDRVLRMAVEYLSNELAKVD